MEKSNLERFISKYHLGGAVGPITIVSDGTTISVNCASDDKNAIIQISTDTFPLEAGEYHIFDTAQFRSLLGVLGSDITVKTKTSKGGTPTSLLISDSMTKVTAVLADKSAIPASPTLKSNPVMEETFSLSDTFVARFLKAKNALAEGSQFAVISDGKESNVVVNYSETQNTSRIEVPFTTDPKDVKKALKTTYFNTEKFAAILTANKEASNGWLMIASNISNGIAQIKFQMDGFTVNYYLVGAKAE